MEDGDEPYLDGIKYHAMPPLKRFRDMEHLSGGEKTMAALALLFAVHSYQPSPFFVLDEVDAALDNANVAKIANYIREHAGPGMQFIVISLKTGLFQGSEALVGIYRDQGANSSKALTLDVSKFFFLFFLFLASLSQYMYIQHSKLYTPVISVSPSFLFPLFPPLLICPTIHTPKAPLET
jgi:structural maintenance of chromosome 1